MLASLNGGSEMLSEKVAFCLMLTCTLGLSCCGREPADETEEGYGPLDAEQEVRTQPGTPITAPIGAIRGARSAADAASDRTHEQESMMDSLLGQ